MSKLAHVFAALLLSSASAQVTAAAPSAELLAAPETSATSRIWQDPMLPGSPEAQALERAGYVREEFFLKGLANVYTYDAAGAVAVERADVPYTTRVLVVRPRDPRRFSGSVQMIPFHPVNGGSSTWGSMASYVVEHGDAFVGVMIGADDNTRHAPRTGEPMIAPAVLKAADPVRYAPIDWGDEDGIRWDVFAAAARKVRDEPNLMGGRLKVRRVFASGWSFTGSFLRTFINAGFHDRYRASNGRPLIDGYLLGISSFSYRSGYVPINSHSANLAEDDRRRSNVAIDVPVIELQSQNEAITNRNPQTADRDTAPGAHRLYEVPGLTHGSGQSGPPYAVVQKTPASACPYPATDVNMADYGQAALANLDLWVSRGIAPPRVPRMASVDGKAIRDENGNAQGGRRPAQLDVPLARYGEPPVEAGCSLRRGLGSPIIQMRRMPLSAERLHALYPGGKREYLRKFDAAADRLLAQRLILPTDAAREKAEARVAADAAFY